MCVERVSVVEKEYLREKSWEVKESANTFRSYSSFLGYMLDKLINKENVLSSYLPAEIVKMHIKGDIYIHKLPHSLWIPYCVEWNYGRILQMSLRTPTLYSKLARHSDSIISHLVNFLFMASQEWTGAQAVSAIDLFLAPFVRHDKLSFRKVKQAMQRLMFELNYPGRMGYQAVFTNITIMLDLSKHYLEEEAIIGGRKIGALSDYIDEALKVAGAIIELQIEGDGVGQPLTFPITTVMVTKEFDWSGRRWGDLSELIFKAMALRGFLYILNGYHRNIGFTYAMCCRLTLDISKLHEVSVWDHEIERTGAFGPFLMLREALES